MGLSVEARSIQALCNEFEVLSKEADSASNALLDAQAEFYRKAKELSNKQKCLLQKMGALEITIQAIQAQATYKKVSFF